MKRVKLLLILMGVLFALNTLKAKALTISEDYTLTNDLTEDVIVSGKNITIDLNGHSIIAKTNGALKVTNGANVIIKGDGIIESTNNNGVVISNGSTLILQSGNIKSVEFGVLVTNNSTFTMNGGIITTSDNCGVGGNGSDNDSYKNYTININGGVINANIKSSGYISCGVYHPNKGTVNMTGGTINSSNGAGIVQRAGTLNISGGVINTKGTSKGKVGDNKNLVTSSSVVVDKKANYPEVSTLKTIISKNAQLNGSVQDIELIGEDIDIQLTGGIYNEEPSEESISEGFRSYKVLAGENEDKYVVVKEDELTDEVADGMVNKTDLPEKEVSLIEKAIKSKYNLLSYYDVSLVTITKDGDIVNYISESNKDITVKLGLPKNIPNLEKGYTRKYYVIRVHGDEVTVIKDVDYNEDGTISFKSNKFSTYAVAYEDVKDDIKTTNKNESSNPKTKDSIVIDSIMLIISLFGLAEGLIYYKNKKACKNR